MIPGPEELIPKRSEIPMPVYEFRCNSCNQKKSVLLRTFGDVPSPVCDNCGSGDMSRLISNVAYHRSTQDVWERSGSPDKPGPDYYKDPRNIGRWAEKKFEDMGQEMPSQVKGMIQAAREGELPENVKSLQPTLKEI
jgi:putative FmdB family regulatory protein